MLSPIATAGPAGVRALMRAADLAEALLDALPLAPSPAPPPALPGAATDAAPNLPPDAPPGVSPAPAPGAWLTQLAAQVPAGLAVAAAPLAAVAPAAPPPPSASPAEIAALELMLADPLHRELVTAHAPSPQALGTTGLAPDLVARYGADLASRLERLARAQAAVRDDFLRALDAAHSAPPGGTGWVASTVFAVPEDGGPQTTWSFDPDRFAAAYAQGSSLAQRAFSAQCAGILGSTAPPATTTVVAHENADVATTRVAGHFTLTGGGWLESGSEQGPGLRSWQPHGLANDGALAVLDVAKPPELHQREAVWFDPALGWVTARENIVVKDGFLDKLAKVSFGVAAAWMVGRLDFLVFGPGTAGQIASQAAVGTTTAAVTQLAFTGRLDFASLLHTALTSSLTAGLGQVPALRPWLAQQPGLDPTRLLGRAGLQGLLQEATGGRFADGALASLANSMAANVGDTLTQGIDAKLQTGKLTPTEASAWRLASQAARSAVAALGHPGDPMAGFAQDYLGALLDAGEALPESPSPTPDALQAAFRAQERQYRVDTDASVAGRTHTAQAGDSISRILGTSDPQAVGNFMRANQLTSERIDAGRSYFVPDDAWAYGEAAALGRQALGVDRLSSADARATQPWDSLRLAAGPRGGAGPAHGDAPASAPLDEVRRLVAFSEIRLDGLGEQPPEFWAARAEALNLAAERYRALNTEPGRPFTTDAIYNTLRADAMQARVLAGRSLDNADLNQSVRLLLETSAVGVVPAATSARPTSISHAIAPSSAELTSAIQRIAREGHALERHGGAVTDEALRIRANTGVAPDGTVALRAGQPVIPKSSSAFYSNEFLAMSDLYVRHRYLDQAIALTPSASSGRVILEGVDIGRSVGRAVDRAGSAPGMAGPLQQHDNLHKVTAVYDRNPITGAWQTTTIYPVP